MRYLTLSALGFGLLLTAALAQAQSKSDRVTVPLMIEKNRPLATITFHKSDGTTRTARFLVDTGGGGFLITEPLGPARSHSGVAARLM